MSSNEAALAPDQDMLSNEERLVQLAKNSDQQAIAALYETHFTRIYRYILARTGSVADAEDLAGEVFLRMIKAIGNFTWEQPFGLSAWLIRMAHNLVVDHLRSQTSRRNRLFRLAAPAYSNDVDEGLMRQVDHDELVAAIGHLSPAQKDVIMLRFVAGLSVAETAGILGKQQGNVKVLQHNALVALRKRMVDTRTSDSDGTSWQRIRLTFSSRL